MKKLNYLALGFLSLSIAFASCKKEETNDELFSSSESTQNDASALDAVESDFLNILSVPNWIDADVDTEPSLINDGISCAIDQQDPDENQAMSAKDGKGKPCAVVNCNFLFASMDLSDAQKLRLRRSIAAYQNCVKNSKERLADLHKKTMEQYRLEHAKLERMYRAGKITKEEFERSIKRIRMHYAQKLEALKDRQMHCKAISKCYRQYLENVKSILTERQWHTYFQCVRRGMSAAAKNHGQATGKR